MLRRMGTSFVEVLSELLPRRLVVSDWGKRPVWGSTRLKAESGSKFGYRSLSMGFQECGRGLRTLIGDVMMDGYSWHGILG